MERRVSNKIKHNKTKNVVYVKLPKYMVPFMRTKHGCPSVFGSLSAYSMILTNHLVCNRFLNHKYTEMSFSSYAYSLMNEKEPTLLLESGVIPKPEDKENLLAVEIPDEVVAYDDEGRLQAVDTNQYYQLTRIGAQSFRERANKEFWTSLGIWLRDGERCVLNEDPSVKGRITRKDLLLKFINHYGIDVVHFETLYRHLQRNLDNLC